MNFEGQDRETEKVRLQDAQVESALRHFRSSVHAWSEQEVGRTRVVRRSRWDAMSRVMARPAMVWSLASALVVVSVGIPVSVQHERQVVADRQAALDRDRAMRAEAARQQAAPTMSDDELLSHVDSDIAQAAPDAMEPLASLMSETAAK
jgi:hypothetical protein